MPESAQPSAASPGLETAVQTALFSGEPVVPLVTAHVPQHPPPVRRATQLGAIALAGITLLVVAALALPRHPAAPGPHDGTTASQPESPERPADLVGTDAERAAVTGAPIAAPVAAAAVAVAPRAASVTSTKTLARKVEKNRSAGSTTSDAPIAAVTPVADLALSGDGAPKLPGSEGIATTVPASVSTGIGGATAVTITGCLEISVDRDDFRLTDTEGVDAPRSRSWRTAFLKKRSAPVALVEPFDRLELQTHVGRRVAATGLLTSHELRVNELRDVGPACN